MPRPPPPGVTRKGAATNDTRASDQTVLCSLLRRTKREGHRMRRRQVSKRGRFPTVWVRFPPTWKRSSVGPVDPPLLPCLPRREGSVCTGLHFPRLYPLSFPHGEEPEFHKSGKKRGRDGRDPTETRGAYQGKWRLFSTIPAGDDRRPAPGGDNRWHMIRTTSRSIRKRTDARGEDLLMLLNEEHKPICRASRGWTGMENDP